MVLPEKHVTKVHIRSFVLLKNQKSMIHVSKIPQSKEWQMIFDERWQNHIPLHYNNFYGTLFIDFDLKNNTIYKVQLNH